MTTFTWGIRTARPWIRAAGLVLALAASAGTVEARGADKPKATDPRLAPPVQPVVVPILSSVTLSPSSLIGGASVLGTVTLVQAAPAGGVTVKFQSSNPALALVPASVVIQPGATSATFVIQTYPVAGNPNVVTDQPSADIAAQIGNSAPRVAKLTIVPATVASLTFEPASVPGGSSSTGRVTITGPAPAGGLGVALTSKDPAVSVPPQATVAAGVREAVFPVTTRAVAVSTPVQITAARGAFFTKTAILTLLPPGMAGISIPNSWLIGGSSTTGSIGLTSPAPAGGAIVNLSVSPFWDSMSCSPSPVVPATVHVPGGASSASFPIATSPYLGTMEFTVRGSYAGTAAAGIVKVTKPHITSLAAPTSLKGGTPFQVKVALDGPFLTLNCISSVNLSSSNALVAQVPAQVAPTPGATSLTVNVTTSAVAQPTKVTISAHYTDSSQVTVTLTPN